MSKRFCDTDLWQKEWYQDLSLKEKILVKYIFENCDCAGVWNGNFKMASFIIGEKVTVDDIKNINARKHQFDILDNGNIFVTDFITFQYGKLSDSCKPHKPVIEKLKKLNLYQRVLIPFQKGIETLEEKDTDKEKEKEKEQVKDNKQDLYFEIKPKLQAIWKQETGENILIANTDLIKAAELAATYPDFFDELPNCIKVLRTIQMPSGYKPSLRFLVDEKNYTDIRNGAYNKASPNSTAKTSDEKTQEAYERLLATGAIK